jgi:phosphoglycolate phosphatase-like HAD superfamily hydrolase
MIRCVAFDFDGTLVLSNAIKREGFFAVAGKFPGGMARMERLLAAPPGDRFAIMAAFAADFGADAGDLAEAYGAWCEARILVCPERPGAAACLAELRARGIPAWINSATPEAPLRAVVARRYPPGSFAGVRGGHASKVPNLRAILAAAGCAPAEMLMVGDGADDRDAARTVGCAFVGLTDGSLAQRPDAGDLLADLSGLAARIDALNRPPN